MDQATIERLIDRFRSRDAADLESADVRIHELAQGLRSEFERTSLGDHAAKMAALIDHTALKPDTSPDDVRRLCEEAVRFGFASVCVNPCYVPLAAALLRDSQVAVCTVVGFPLGASRPKVKAEEARMAVREGADEVDMVLNVGMLKSGYFDYVEADIRFVVEAVGESVVTKVILETALLTDEEKVAACLLAESAGADFVKTSTGFSSGGATSDDVQLMRRIVGDRLGVKASGGIRTAHRALEMIGAGASRIGASSSIAIVEGANGHDSVDPGSSDY